MKWVKRGGGGWSEEVGWKLVGENLRKEKKDGIEEY